MSVLVGRETLVAQIDRCRAEVVAGQGRLVLITGEAGIGKSTLADVVLTRAGLAGFETARTHAVDDPGAPSLWPWQRLGRSLPQLRALLGPAPAEAAAAAQRFGVFDAVSAQLARLAEPSGLVILIDDLHWADATSLLLLRHITADLAGSRLMLVATARQAGGKAWDEQRADLVRATATRVVTLEGLSADAVRHWLAGTPERREWLPDAEQLTAATGGNPFYIRLLTSASPSRERGGGQLADVVAEVAGRLRVLPEPTRELIEIAAVAGDSVSTMLLAAVTGRSEQLMAAELAPACSAEILGGPDAVAFVHALVRDAVVAATSSARRAQLHGGIAAALGEMDDPDLYGSVAEHWRQAGGVAAAENYVIWADRAARVAADRFDPQRAVGYLRSALTQARRLGLPAGRRAELAVALATCEFQAGDLAAAIETCSLASDLAEAADRPELVADAALVVHGVGAWDAVRTVIDLCERALRMLPTAAAVRRSRVLSRLSAALTETVDPRRGADLSVEALRLAEATGDPVAELDAIAARHLAITVPEAVHERIALARRAIELQQVVARPSLGAVWGHLWLLMGLHQLGDLDGAHEQAEQIRRIAERQHSPIARWHHLRVSAAYAGMIGDFDRARELDAAALLLAVRIGDDSMVGIHHAFVLFLAAIRGDPADLDPGTIPGFRAGPRMPLVRALLTIALIIQGERDEAAAVFEELRSLPDQYETGVRRAGTIGQIGVAATMLGDVPVAARAYELTRDQGGRYDGDGSGFIVAMGSMDRLIADFALTAGHIEDAVRRYADAVIANARIGARPFVALSRLGWASALLARWRDPALRSSASDLAAATSLAGQAAAEFRRLDMPGPLRLADRLLADLAAAVRSGNPLTARENEVVAMVAKGRRNKEIAAALVLSERTVESHVRNVLVKLDLGSRAEIAGWLVARSRDTPDAR